MLTDIKEFSEVNRLSHRGGYEYSYSGVRPEVYEEYIADLIDRGYECYSKNKIDENSFVIMLKSAEQVHIAYYPHVAINNYEYPVLKADGHHDYNFYRVKDVTQDSFMKVSVTKPGYLPKLDAPKFEKLAEPTITQMKQMGIGMSYVIQLVDGSFIIIDGGLGVDGSLEYHLDYLESHKPHSHEKPRVAWFFTHAHVDHIILPVKFIEKYGDKVDITLFAYNFIDETTEYAQRFRDGGRQWTETLLDTVRKNGADVLVLHTGQVIRLAGCDIHVLNTYEDTYPKPVGTLNSTSTIFKLVFKDMGEQRSVMIVGDSTETNTSFVNAVYSKSTLKSDILQVSHHGVNASVGTQHLKEFYTAVNPSVALCSNLEKTVTEAAFVPNFALGGARWVYADEEHTITIFD